MALNEQVLKCDILEDRVPFNLLCSAEVAYITLDGMQIRSDSDTGLTGTVMVFIKLKGSNMNRRGEIVRRHKDEDGANVITIKFLESAGDADSFRRNFMRR